MDDLVRGTVSFESKDIGDWVLVKANGIPTYNFAVVFDDHFMKISHVFRGEEHLTNTPKQLMIFDVFGWEYPRYGHMTLIVNEDRKKLSKRDESIIQFISQYKDLGYLPEAMFNFFALLGWSPGGEEEIFSHDELVQVFDESRLSKSPSMFDKQKLTWMNNQYVKKMSLEEVVDFALPHLQEAGLVNKEMTEKESEWAHDLIALYHDQLSFGAEIVELSAQFFKDDIEYDEESQAVLSGGTSSGSDGFVQSAIEALETFDAASIKELLKLSRKKRVIKGKTCLCRSVLSQLVKCMVLNCQLQLR